MRSINIYSKNDIEKIVEDRLEKALTFRITNLENAIDKLRERLNFIEILQRRFNEEIIVRKK